MKTYLFNSTQIKLLGFTIQQRNLAVELFPKVALEFGITIQPVYKPKELCDLKLVNGDEEDFIAICGLVKEELL